MAALALWRLSSLLAREPIFAWWRGAFGVVHDADGNPIGYTGAVSQGAQCLWCVSVWCAPAILLMLAYAPLLVAALALSAVACLLHTAWERVQP